MSISQASATCEGFALAVGCGQGLRGAALLGDPGCGAASPLLLLLLSALSVLPTLVAWLRRCCDSTSSLMLLRTSRSERSTSPDSHCVAASRMKARKGASSWQRWGVHGGHLWPASQACSAALTMLPHRQPQQPHVCTEGLLHLAHDFQRQPSIKGRETRSSQRQRVGRCRLVVHDRPLRRRRRRCFCHDFQVRGGQPADVFISYLQTTLYVNRKCRVTNQELCAPDVKGQVADYTARRL